MKCGYIEKGSLFPTEEGSPQGGVISPTYANMVLDGLEPMILNVYWRSKTKKTMSVKYNTHKVHVVRFADDFIVLSLSTILINKIIKKSFGQLPRLLTVCEV